MTTYAIVTVQVQDVYTHDDIQNATVTVKKEFNGSWLPVSPEADGTYIIDIQDAASREIQVGASASGYQAGATGTYNVSEDVTVTRYLNRTPAPTFSGNKFNYRTGLPDGTYAAVTPYTATLYEKNGDTWTQLETGTFYRIGFYTTLNSGKTYKIAVSKEGYDPREYEFTGAYPTAFVYLYTKPTDASVIETISYYDAVSGDQLAGVESEVYDCYADETEFGEVKFNSYLNSYILYSETEQPNLTKYKISAAKDGYEDTSSVEPDTVRGSVYNPNVNMYIEPEYTSMIISVTDADKGTEISDATITVTDETTGTEVIPESGIYTLIYNQNRSYTVRIEKTDYTPCVDTITPMAADPIAMEVQLQKIYRYCKLYVTIDPAGAEVSVTYDGDNLVPLTDGYYLLVYNDDKTYYVEASADGYKDYTSEPIHPVSPDDITLDIQMESTTTYATLTVTLKDADTGADIEGATVTVKNETTGEEIYAEDGKWNLETGNDYYRIYAAKSGYTDTESTTFQAPEEAAIHKILYMTSKLEPFATVTDMHNRTGINYTAAERERLQYLLEDVSNLIRSEGRKCGVNVDAKVSSDPIYASIVKTVTCDVTQRVMRQSMTGDAMTQESQSALGYTWSGTYAIPGGGIAMSLMRNEKDILGFDAMTIGVIDLC